MAIKTKTEKEVEVVEPLQTDYPPMKIIVVGMSTGMPTGEGDMPAYEIENLVGHWIKQGYKIAPNGVHVTGVDAVGFYQFVFVLVKYPE